MCVFYCIVYTLAPEIKFTSFTNWWTRLTVILAASWKTKVSPISVIWLHGILKCYVTFNWPWSSWCKEGAEKSFFRDAKHEDTFFLINQAHSISISAENFCVIRLALNRTFTLMCVQEPKQKNVTNFGRFTFQVNSYYLKWKVFCIFFGVGYEKCWIYWITLWKYAHFDTIFLPNTNHFTGGSEWTAINIDTKEFHIIKCLRYESHDFPHKRKKKSAFSWSGISIAHE